MKLISSFSERFKKALEIRNIKPSKFSEMVDINKSTISQYLSGEYEPKRNRIDLFAKKLEVDEAWLIGYDVPMERRTTKPAVKEVRTVARDEKVFNKFDKLSVERRKIIEDLINSYFDEDMEDEE